MTGDNRYHSIFGAVKSCIAVNPGDTAPALVALRAKMKTNRRTLDAESFWDVRTPGSTVLEAGEILLEIQMPNPSPGVKSSFIKFALRKAIDFPVVNCAAAIGGGSAAICLNAVYNKPYRAIKAATVADARVLPGDRNKWKIPIAQAMVKRAILACSQE